jgi:hypothetical protein
MLEIERDEQGLFTKRQPHPDTCRLQAHRWLEKEVRAHDPHPFVLSTQCTALLVGLNFSSIRHQHRVGSIRISAREIRYTTGRAP